LHKWGSAMPGRGPAHRVPHPRGGIYFLFGPRVRPSDPLPGIGPPIIGGAILARSQLLVSLVMLGWDTAHFCVVL